MIRTITKHHVFSVLNKAGETVATLELPKTHIRQKPRRKFYQKMGMTRIIN